MLILSITLYLFTHYFERITVFDESKIVESLLRVLFNSRSMNFHKQTSTHASNSQLILRSVAWKTAPRAVYTCNGINLFSAT